MHDFHVNVMMSMNFDVQKRDYVIMLYEQIGLCVLWTYLLEQRIVQTYQRVCRLLRLTKG